MWFVDKIEMDQSSWIISRYKFLMKVKYCDKYFQIFLYYLINSERCIFTILL